MAKWKKREVADRIRAALGPVVALAGFRYRKRNDTFVRAIEGGDQHVYLPLWDLNPLFEFSLTLGVRLEAAQPVVNPSPGSPGGRHTIVAGSTTQLEFFGLLAEPGRGVLWRASSEAELSAVLPAVTALVRERVLPFFEEYRDARALNRGLNPPGAERVFALQWPGDRRTFDATNPPYRAMAGVAAAHLANDPRFDALVAAYRAQLRDMPEAERRKFEELVAHVLEVRPPGGGSRP